MNIDPRAVQASYEAYRKKYGLPAWDELTTDQRRTWARQVEAVISVLDVVVELRT